MGAAHRCNDMAKGERCQKDVYEALRAGPKWSSTLLIIVYDDAGGFYDQIIPPFEGVPKAVSSAVSAPPAAPAPPSAPLLLVESCRCRGNSG